MKITSWGHLEETRSWHKNVVPKLFRQIQPARPSLEKPHPTLAAC